MLHATAWFALAVPAWGLLPGNNAFLGPQSLPCAVVRPNSARPARGCSPLHVARNGDSDAGDGGHTGSADVLSLQELDVPLQSSPDGYRDYVERECSGDGRRVVRWHISSVDERSGLAKAEAVVLGPKAPEKASSRTQEVSSRTQAPTATPMAPPAPVMGPAPAPGPSPGPGSVVESTGVPVEGQARSGATGGGTMQVGASLGRAAGESSPGLLHGGQRPAPPQPSPGSARDAAGTGGAGEMPLQPGRGLRQGLSEAGQMRSRQDVLRLWAAGAPLALLLAWREDSDDVGNAIRSFVQGWSDLLNEANNQFDERSYVVFKNLQGKGDAVNPQLKAPPTMEMEFAELALAAPQEVFLSQPQVKTSRAEFEACVAARGQEVFPYFEKNRGGVGSIPMDPRNHDYFNFLTYCQWKEMAPQMKTRAQQTAFLDALGDTCLRTLMRDEDVITYEPRRTGGLLKVIEGCRRILQRFQSQGFMAKFNLQADLVDQTSFTDGGPAQFSLILSQEAPLGAKIFLDFEGYKYFLPNHLPATVAAYLRSCGVSPTYEQFYLDETYRPNVSDYTPSQTLIQWTLEEQDFR